MRSRFPRHMLLRWVGIDFVILSLVLILLSIGLFASMDHDGPGVGATIFVVVLLSSLLNLGLGVVIFLTSFCRRRTTQDPSSISPQPHWFKKVLYSGMLAIPLYGITTVVSLIATSVVFTNGLMWWYHWQMPKITLGDSRQHVEQVLGQPGWHSECNNTFARNYSRVTDLSRCASISLYYQYQRTQQWEIAYDTQNQVISKQYFQRQP